MARCMKSEKQGHFVFYGAMVCEGVIALIWAAAGCSLYEVTDGLNTGLAQALAMGQSKAIYDVCSKTMGGVGIALAMIGVVVCPITSGDTAFRSVRLPGRPAGGFCLCRETTNCGKKNRNADKMHKNMLKSLAGCTKNEKTPAETISKKKFCRGYVKKYLPGFPGTADLYSF